MALVEGIEKNFILPMEDYTEVSFFCLLVPRTICCRPNPASLTQQLFCINSQEWSNGLRDILQRLRKDKVPLFGDQFNPSVISAD